MGAEVKPSEARVSTPADLTPAEAASAYVALADQINRRWLSIQDVRKEAIDGTAPNSASRAYVDAFADIEADAWARLDALAFPDTVVREVDALKGRVQAVREFLDEDRDGEFVLLLDYGLTRDADSEGANLAQIAFANALRKGLGLPSIMIEAGIL